MLATGTISPMRLRRLHTTLRRPELTSVCNTARADTRKDAHTHVCAHTHSCTRTRTGPLARTRTVAQSHNTTGQARMHARTHRLVGNIPFPLFWLRYSLFIVLYPSGISGELIQVGARASPRA